MHGLLALAMAVVASSGTVTYKCRDAAGNWTAQACNVVVPTIESNYIREQRERAAVMRIRRETRDRLAMYCFRQDPKGSLYDCVDGQMIAYDFINRLAKELGPVSSNSARLGRCLSDSQDARSAATDYRQAMACYFER